MIATLTNLAETGSFVPVLEQKNQTSNEYVKRYNETFLCCDEKINFIEEYYTIIDLNEVNIRMFLPEEAARVARSYQNWSQ